MQKTQSADLERDLHVVHVLAAAWRAISASRAALAASAVLCSSADSSPEGPALLPRFLLTQQQQHRAGILAGHAGVLSGKK